MADSVPLPMSAALPVQAVPAKHSVLVRSTHWITFLCFAALLISGVEIMISHPRFYWGETGNVNTPPLFQLHIPASRGTVPTGYGYVLPDQNGWSRYLHFQSAWLLVFTGALYVVYGLVSGHFRRHIAPRLDQLRWHNIVTGFDEHLRLARASAESYNVQQRLSYVVVIFVLFPLVIWTGLAMSPAVVSAFPWTVTTLGGQQSARTIHFFVSLALVLFLVVHVAMVFVTGFRSRMRAMILSGQSTEGGKI